MALKSDISRLITKGNNTKEYQYKISDALSQEISHWYLSHQLQKD